MSCRWYRAPELLFGSRQYTGAIDMWAVGCIFAELMLRVPFVAGNSDMNQLDLIFHALGTPTESDWPGMTKLPDYVKFERTYPKTDLRSLFTGTGADALELLKGMLEYDPKKRLTARQALASQYFRNQPLPTLPQDLPKPSANPIVESESETTRQQVDKKRKVDQAFAEIVDNGDETQTAWKSKLEPVAKKLEFVRSPAA
ncbi:TFIIH complex serine/threonine-protein kinase subunit kin28 [Spiromyces aspiralis]|uniref:TFIIH complex serine/threonine-protein kinase subunit kin28 n=1 Tax=Spiromyces aspiralis TaxID=68401 RepID=A0ACC1H9A5_9FUNG|nr:TFIIH complex serine/threonine-protein kinase subunit kin28 [Spiromyces aspiralis]